MAFVINDRVKETTTTTGTGVLAWSPVVPGVTNSWTPVDDSNTNTWTEVDDREVA